MKALAIVAIVCTIALYGCAPPVRTLIPITGTFDPDEVSFAKQKGDNTINGQAFMRQRGGGVVTCAGSEVSLIPSGSYSRERIMALYGTISIQGVNLFGFRARHIPKPPPEFLASIRGARCDASGNFTFANVPDGSYFVGTTVNWYVPQRGSQGGNIMSPVTVSGGEEKNIVMSN